MIWKMACHFSTFAHIKQVKMFTSPHLIWLKYLWFAGDAAKFRYAVSLHNQMGIDLSNQQSNWTCWSYSAAIIFVWFNSNTKQKMQQQKNPVLQPVSCWCINRFGLQSQWNRHILTSWWKLICYYTLKYRQVCALSQFCTLSCRLISHFYRWFFCCT